MDIGRNDPCPCGSGKKYKRCCGALAVTDPLEQAGRAMRAVQDTVEPKVLRFIRQEIGDDAIERASNDFGLPNAGPRAEDPESQLFLPWLLYDWRREFAGTRPAETPEEGVPAARRFLVAYGHRLDERERQFAETVSATPFSFHEVLDAERGRSLRLRDVILGTEATAYEQSGSAYLRPGDLTYARVVPFDDVALIIGCASLVLPPIEKHVVLDLRASLRKSFRSVTPDLVRRLEPQFRELYFTIRQRLLQPRLPILQNTDGDPMELHTLTYGIEEPEAAFSALASLAAGMEPDELLDEAKYDRRGRLQHVEFRWSKADNAKHGGMPTTTLASFTIDRKTLTVEVNSAERARAVQGEIAKRLKSHSIFLRDEIQAMDDLMAEAASKRETAKERAARKRDEDLQALPEIQAMIAKMNADHYATWPDVPLPALKGKTPRAAVRTKDGRERVEALLADFERMQESGRSKMPPYDFNQLRDALGLSRATQRALRSVVPPLDDTP
jgi:hypothetical protein